MDKENLLKRLSDIEWEDFEVTLFLLNYFVVLNLQKMRVMVSTRC